MADDSLYTREEQLKDTSAQRPHLVILGAGASRAACPTGDKKGCILPLMCDTVKTLDLGKHLKRAGVPYARKNFELVYAAIAANPSLQELKQLVESRVAEYFGTLELPEKPTVYDYLVLSLRHKDVIATFNWDPFLVQAFQRNHRRVTFPQVLFLHGCSIVGSCMTDKKQGIVGHRCPVCGHLYTPTRLLYPVRDKDYVSDPYIASQWKSLSGFLGAAFLVTIFGYGAPDSDAAAIDLMSKAWGSPEERELEEIEIIDIKAEDTLRSKWDRFIHSHHYQVHGSYFESILANYPRRSVEAYWQSLIEARFREENPVPLTDSFSALWDWFSQLTMHEKT